MSLAGKTIRSMTGFGSVEGEVAGQRMRMEIKALNHRFLDVKVRLPREFSSAEIQLRAALQAQFSRGSIEIKLERSSEGAVSAAPFEPNLALATQYHECLLTLQKRLGLKDPISTMDIASFPDVILRSSGDYRLDEAWKHLEPVAREAMAELTKMREHEGAALAGSIRQTLDEFEETVASVRERRKQCEAGYRKKLSEKITAIFDSYPVAGASTEAVLQSRISQELALLLDRTDIEEELTRFHGHIGHFRKTLDEGGPVGRKLDFILQEIGREVNTLGNKAQDFSISEEVVHAKVRLEQLREQVMNLE